MAKTKTSRYDVAEHLRTPEEIAAYLEACLEEADGDDFLQSPGISDSDKLNWDIEHEYLSCFLDITQFVTLTSM